MGAMRETNKQSAKKGKPLLKLSVTEKQFLVTSL